VTSAFAFHEWLIKVGAACRAGPRAPINGAHFDKI
jgi:hypothetical protein